ncbi:MAG: autotransporter domain-containing protein, partial [Acidobacteria bacterium]|nr:autotransporter domain-containing protein [Acidobacteriota bacterium]
MSASYATAGGTAEEGADYTATSGTLTFAPGEDARTIPVPTREDEIDEQAETFTLSLSNPAGATIRDGTATGTINDDDEAPVIVITDDEAEEGEPAEFTVTLSAITSRTVTVDYATAGGTAEEGADYTATTGTLTFAPGEDAKTIPVPTREDEIDELTETFTVNLRNPDGATIQDGTATGTIDDDDEPPVIVITDAEAEEGEPAEFTITLSAITSRIVTVYYATAGATAEEGADYAAASGTLTFAPGEDARTIPVPTLEDEIDELNETFTLDLANPHAATLRDGAATGTIIDDDEPPVIVITDAEAEEGDPVEFTIALSAVTSRTVTVTYATAGGTAEEGADYTATSGTLTFVPGEETKTIAVLTLEDEIDERNETFTLDLGNPHAATLQNGAATGTINDDDEPVLFIGDAEAREGDAAEFLVTMWPAGDEAMTVSFRTVDGTAVAGLDYTSTMGTLRFEPGETSATIAVSTLTDELADDIERFTLELSDPVEATVGDATGVGTIGDDPTPRIEAVNRTILPEVGRALAFNAVTCRFDRPLSTTRGGNGTRNPAGRLSLSHALLAGRRTSPNDRRSAPAGPWNPPADPWSSPARAPLTLEQALGNSSFLMPSTDGEGGAGRYTAWGCADYLHLAGSGNGSLSWDGIAFSARIGADLALGSNTLAGVAVSRSRSAFNYTGLGGGPDEVGAHVLRLTGVNPYVAWSVTPQLDVWGTVGHAWGELQIDDELGAGSLSGTATLNSGMVGINGRLLTRGGTTLRLRGEGGLAHLGVTGDGGFLSAVGLDMRRVRLGTEASYEHVFPFEATLTPWGELGLRHDGGDGETGAGLEVRGGLRYRYVPRGLTVEGYGRRLVMHEGAVRESGFGLMLRVDPGESGLGPSMSLTPAWGETTSGIQQLWDDGA